MKEFIYLDTDYLTSALAQLNNGKILTYSNEGATTSTDESKKTSSSQNTSKVNFGLPKVIGVNLGNDKTSEDSSAFIDIKSAKEIITKTFDDNAFDILLEHIQKSDGVSDSNYKDGDFVVLNNEYKLIDFDFLLTLLGDDFIELYINSAISNNKIEKSKENNFRSAQKKYYKELEENRNIVLEELKKEKIKFNKTLSKGLKEFDKMVSSLQDNKLNKDLAFKLYDTYGFPIELTLELAKEQNIEVDVDGFYEKFKKHQELSRKSSSGKFKGGLSNNSEIETKYHTATHLLNAALKLVVNKDVHQKGSNITEERMRFDFSCDHKLSDEEIKKAEDIVNTWINEGLDVICAQMNKEDAIKSGAECMFIERYPDVVTVYTIGDISKELCGGPHVKNTKELGHFKIIKEEASSSGVRRIKAILE